MSAATTRSAWHLSSLLFVVVAFAGAFFSMSSPEATTFVVPSVVSTASRGRAQPSFVRTAASSGATASVHSATAVELDDGRLRAFWYGGSREGASDVSILGAVFDPTRGRWSAEKQVVTRDSAQVELGRSIRKLGNPVVARDGSGRLWLFYVSVSVGGWSGSAINFKLSEDEGETWGRSRRLVTSPFLNVATLVRGPAFVYKDGTLGLPVYHEFLGKFSELLRLDATGRVLDKIRLDWGRASLQPVVVPVTAAHAVALLRYSGGPPRRILTLRTEDVWQGWTGPDKLQLPNPDAAVSAIRTQSGDLILAFNDSAVDRGNLTLARSTDHGASWNRVRVVEPVGARTSAARSPELRFAYPWLMQTRDGQFHLLYTDDRRVIRHARFNRAWLEQE